MSLGMLTLTLIAALFLVGASQTRKNQFYRNLLMQCESLISKTEPLVPDSVNENQINEKFQETIQDSLAKIIVISKEGYAKEVRYYYKKNLMVIDRLDEREKVVRRDIFDAKGRIRIRTYYDYNGNRTRRDYLNIYGKRIDRESFFVPLGGRTGY
jgi:hypothetical protein